MKKIQEFLNDFPITYETPVAWGEMDAFQHVNNIIYFRYFESVRIRYFYESGLMQSMQENQIGPILKDTYCRYLIPVSHPDSLSIGARITVLKKDEFTHEYRVISHQHKKIAAQGTGIIVAYDYLKNQKTNFPTGIIQKIQKIEGPTLQFES